MACEPLDTVTRVGPDDEPTAAVTTDYRMVASTAQGIGFAGSQEALQECPATSACSAELWGAVDGDAAMTLVRSDDQMWPAGTRERWPTTWRGLAGPLAVCIGDALAVPVADDPQAFRLLQQTESAWTWALVLSGTNACGLAGTVHLSATRDRVLSVDLSCDSKRWREGGQACAREKSRGVFRARAELSWPTLSPADKLQTLSALEKDPEAAELVVRLKNSL